MDYELELSRLELEQSRVGTARMEMLHNIRQREAEIRRFREQLLIQEAKVAELTAKYTELSAAAAAAGK